MYPDSSDVILKRVPYSLNRSTFLIPNIDSGGPSTVVISPIN